MDQPFLTIVIRWATFGALLVVIGAPVVRLAVLDWLFARTAGAGGLDVDGRVQTDRRIAAWGAVAAGALLPLAVGRLCMQVAELRDPSEPWSAPAAMMLRETEWGA